jgi:DNA polymerase I-like protein with 3'-5' exonuclease and polymerase domains
MLALDIETTGIDFWHGCRPFALSICDEEGGVSYWEWEVDPYNREVQVNSQNLSLCMNLLSEDSFVGHNVGFDMRGVELLWPLLDYDYEWQWNAIEDTLIASHALRNLWPHGLKSLRETVLFLSNETVDFLHKSVDKARRICRTKRFQTKHGKWRIADSADPHWPAITTAPKSSSGDSGWWVLDMWLPATIVRLAPEFLPPEQDYLYPGADFFLHPWENILRDYNIEDSMTTLVLWETFKQQLKDEDLWEQYEERKSVLEAAYKMTNNGITIKQNIKTETQRYKEKAHKYRATVEKIMRKCGIKEPNLGSPIQLRKLLFEHWKLPVVQETEGGFASVAADVLEKLQNQDLPQEPQKFVENLLLCRRTEKAMESLESYTLWSTPHGSLNNVVTTRTTDKSGSGTYDTTSRIGNLHAPISIPHHSRIPGRHNRYIHPSVNVTGTRFTRQSSSNPNLQNVGTGRDDGGVIEFNLRVVFGPAPGRIWLDVDYSNIELRIWGYECGNKEFIKAFEQDQSVHLIIARELHPHLQKMTDEEAKNTKAYKYTKNGDFAIIYGASPGLADETYKVKGAYNKLSKRFPEVRQFTERLHRQVQQRGYIETMTGYRLYIPKGEPHKAVSGRVQGTAGSIIGRAMAITSTYLEDTQYVTQRDPKLILQIHDELLFDFPEDMPNFDTHIHNLLTLMEVQGKAIGIPLPVEGKLIREDWSTGETVKRK